MALADVVWGTWRYGNIGLSSKNGMRLGMAIYWSSPNSGSASATATVEIWTENEFTHSGDTQTLNYTNLSPNKDYTNNSGGSPVLRDTRSYSYTYSTWGSSPGAVTLAAELTGHYWDDGTNPTISRTATIPARPGGVPTGETISASANVGSISVSWSASADPGITQYNVYRNNDPAQLIYASTGTSLTDYVGNGASAYYVMYAYNAVGNSGAAVSSTVTTPTVASAPTSFAANNSTFGQITLSWGAPSSNGGSGVTSYVLRNGSTVLQNTGATSYTHTGLSPYTDYSYTVTAANAVGESAAASLTIKTMGGIAKVWNGTAWVTTLPQVWTGAVWANAQARMYDNVGATEDAKWKHGI
jgi:hypothetical protein